VKLCSREDFEDPEFLRTLHEIEPGREDPGHLHRKYWEYAMLGLYLEEVGALREDAQALAVGAGHETPLFWLTNRIGRVVATDIYGAGDFADREASATMLTDPAAFAPYPYRADRLEVADMDARRLEFPDESFDIVFSLSSIEHFGGPADIRKAASEMARVVRPDGRVLILDYHGPSTRRAQLWVKAMSGFLRTWAGRFDPPTERYIEVAGLKVVARRSFMGDLVTMLTLQRDTAS